MEKRFRFFFKKRNLEHENYILFSLNFSLLSKSQLTKYEKFLKQSKYTSRGISIKGLRKSIRDSFRIYKKFSKLIIAITKKTDHKIIVRPHPTDPINNYKFLKKYHNVSVIKKGSISEWLDGAKLVIHSGCSGGSEASVKGIPTISFCPFKSTHGHKFANIFSKKTKNLKECIMHIQKLTKDGLKSKKDKRKDIKYRAHNILSKKTGYQIIANEFTKLQNIVKFKKKNNNLALKIKFKIRDLRSKILNYKYGNIKFSTFERDETLKVFKTLKELNPKYNDLSVNFIKKDIIYINNKY